MPIPVGVANCQAYSDGGGAPSVCVTGRDVAWSLGTLAAKTSRTVQVVFGDERHRGRAERDHHDGDGAGAGRGRIGRARGREHGGGDAGGRAADAGADGGRGPGPGGRRAGVRVAVRQPRSPGAARHDARVDAAGRRDGDGCRGRGHQRGRLGHVEPRHARPGGDGRAPGAGDGDRSGDGRSPGAGGARGARQRGVRGARRGGDAGGADDAAGLGDGGARGSGRHRWM